MKKIVPVFTLFCLTAFLLLAPVFAAGEDILDDTAASEAAAADMTLKIQIVGGILIGLVVVFLLVKNRHMLFKSPSSRNNPSAPIDEDKVVDKIRLDMPEFSRDEFKKMADEAILTIQDGLTKRNASLLKPHETEYLYSAHERQIREYRETGRTYHLEDKKIISTELAEYEKKEDSAAVTVKITMTLLDYTANDADGTVLDGSKLAHRTRSYRLEFVRKTGDDMWRVNNYIKWSRET